MAFWGVEIKAGKPYTLQYDDEKGRLHVSQATLGDGSSRNKTVVVCNIGDKKPIYLCSLFPERMETCTLNVEFEEYEEVTLSIVGPHSVHLSGYFFNKSPDDDGDSDDSDSCEDCEPVDSLEDYSDGGDCSDDDMEMFPSSTTRSSGVRIEEITDDDNLNEKDLSKRPKKNDNNDNSQDRKNDSSVPVLESEDEDGFPVSSPAKSKAFVSTSKETEEITGEGTGGQPKRKINNDDSVNTKSTKRNKDDIVKDGDQERQTSQPSNISSPTPEVSKKAKKNKKKKQRDQGGKMQKGSKSTAEPELLKNQKQTNGKGHDVDADAVGSKVQSDEKNMKKNKKSKQQENTADAVADKNVSTKKGEKAEEKPSQARSFPNGLVIEELEMGRPDGKRAAPGKKVSVRYIGKLKNGKIFDSNIGKAPFKFRLGVGEVIKGWDVGVNGMRVGDKRRLTIPPAMGYGARGAGGAIPPNAWLLFDVELVDAS